MKATTPFIVIVITIALLLGVIAGFGVAKTTASNTTGTANAESADGTKSEKAAGIADKSTFKDQATGVLKEGGFEGEGSFHLERPGGKSQTVYLTSSAVDLSEFLGKKVTVWGETHSSEKAGWLMDVGYVEVQ